MGEGTGRGEMGDGRGERGDGRVPYGDGDFITQVSKHLSNYVLALCGVVDACPTGTVSPLS